MTFREIVRHLQGYHIKPKNNEQFVRLFADAQFYGLPRLMAQLFESEIYMQIGDRDFCIPRDLFSNLGDSPNYFSLGFAICWSNPKDVFPGLDRNSLLRPPPINPPAVPNRSGEIFADIIRLLHGYPLHIRNEEHRASILRDCRYYHLRGLEQKVIPHEISENPLRGRSEIVIRLEDVRQSGVQFSSDTPVSSPLSDPGLTGGWVVYARPFVDDKSHYLIIEIGGDSATLDLTSMRADFHGLTKARVSSLFQVVANKMNLPTKAPLGLMMMSGGASTQPASPAHSALGEDRVAIRIDRDTDLVVDGESYAFPSSDDDSNLAFSPQPRPMKRRRIDMEQMGSDRLSPFDPSSTNAYTYTSPHAHTETSQLNGVMSRNWIVRTGQWRLRVQRNESANRLELVFIAVKLDVYTTEWRRNRARQFLSGG